MKTSELTGALLDLWVARAEGDEPYEFADWWAIDDDEVIGDRMFIGDPNPHPDDTQYAPSSDWAQGGLIIERERIELRHLNDGWCAQILNQRCYYGTDYSTLFSGNKINTPLIAAMRAFVASKFGEEVPGDHEAAQPAAE